METTTHGLVLGPLTILRQGTAGVTLVAMLLGAAGCTRTTRPVMPAAAAPETAERPGDLIDDATTAVLRLRAELAQLFNAPRFDHALWGVAVRSLDTGQDLYRLNATKLMMPASNMKIVTLAATAERLGWDYRYETDLLTAAPIESGVLQGDLIVRGSGDPTINRRHGEPAVFDTWADELKCLGVSVIDGRIIGDDNAFDEDDLGAGWAWDYLGYGYATPGGALQYNENIVSLRIQPGDAIGDPVAIDIQPPGSGLQLNIRAVTRPADEGLRLNLRRLPDQPVLDVIGVVPIGIEPFVRTASVHNPTEFFVRAFHAALMSSGIEVRGDAIDVDALPGADPISHDESASPLRSLYTHRSPPLSDAGTVLMKVSQNLYAETLLETLGGQRTRGTVEAGRDVVRSVLTSWGISPDEYVQYDGSGLSRYNYVTADMLIKILARMHRDPNHATAFTATLPIAGRDGSLERRMIGTRAEGNARAKTGSISNVRALSGYVNTSDDELLAFSIIANHFHLPQAAIDTVADLAVERLAHFTRR